MKTIIACYQVKENWGYAVALFEIDSEYPLYFYTAGNHSGDSKIFATPISSWRVSRGELLKWAKQSLKDAIDEYTEKFGEAIIKRVSKDLIHSEKMGPDHFWDWVSYPAYEEVEL